MIYQILQRRGLMMKEKIRNSIILFLNIITAIEIVIIVIFINKIGIHSSFVYICLLIQIFFLNLNLKKYDTSMVQYMLIICIFAAVIFIGTILANAIS